MPTDPRDADEYAPHEGGPSDDDLAAAMALEPPPPTSSAEDSASPPSGPPSAALKRQERPLLAWRARACGMVALALSASADTLREAFWLPALLIQHANGTATNLMTHFRATLLVLGVLLLLGSMAAARRWLPPVPREEDPNRRDAQRRSRLALATFGVVVFVGVRWWSIHGPALMARLYDGYATWNLYWTQVATPEERSLWIMLAGWAVAAAGLGIWLLHRFVWRAFFPDLVRRDPEHHRGARPERVGRLFRVKPFLAHDGRVTHRVFYKHGNHLLPIFRFDYFDVEKSPQLVLYGVSQVRCGRLERDPREGRFKRIPNASRHGSAPLETEFREAEVVEDHNRKTGIVMPGSAMNPEVMRHKFREERLINPHVARKSRDAMRPQKFARPHRLGGPRTGPAAHVDRVDEPRQGLEE